MSSRVAGAGLALIAVALLAVSLVTPVVLPGQLSLFAGHPTVSGHTRETQEVYVGLYTARLCNSGGDGTCKSGDATTGFRLTGYAELGATGLLAFAAVLLALLTLRKSEGRKAMARLVWIAGAVAAAAGVGLILQGPFRGASVPIGLGMALHGAGIVGAMLAGAIAVRPPPPLRLRVGDRGSQPLAALPSAQAFSLRGTGPAGAPRGAAREAFGDASGGFDRRVLRDDGQLRPADPRPEPRAGVDGRMRPPAAVEPAPPAGFAAPQPASERPLFSSAPQLRPLYDAAPTQGGTGGLLPIERPVIPTGPLTPVPRAAMSAVVGLQDPAGGDESRIAQPPLFSDEPRPARPKAASLPPPLPLAATASAGPAPLAAPPSPFAAASPPPLPFAAASPPPLPFAAAPPPLPFAASPPPSPFAEPTGSLPRTQIAPVPPMPEAIARPAAQAAASGAWPAGSSPATNPSASPRPETPLAEPPAPPSAGVPPAPASAPPLPARAHRESQLPLPRRGVPPTRPPLRATVPMPARPSGSGTIPPRLTMPTPLRDAPPRPTMTAPVPPIPAIPPIPPPLRAETDVTADEAAAGLGAASPETRVPVEVGDDISQTNVSVDLPVPEVEAASSGGADGAGEPSDTSPSGEPVAGAAAGTSGTQPLAPASATSAPEPATSAASAPQVRDRPMPKLPISTAPDSLPPPRDNKQAIGPSPACPQCESPMAWVEEHLRFYCKSCRMYF